MKSILYHSLKADRAKQCLSNNEIKGYTGHRMWEDGTLKKDDSLEYDDCFYMKGLSTTRSFEYAKNWNSVVLELDKDLLKHNHKIVLYNWGHLIGNGYKQRTIKRELEEFVVTGRMDNFEIGSFRGSLKGLDKFIVNIYIDEFIIDLYGEDDENIKFIMNHPKFNGTYTK